MTNILFYILFLSLTYAIGIRCFRLTKCKFSFIEEELLFSIGLGFGIVSYAIFFMGILGILYTWVILLASAIMFFLFNSEIKSFFTSITQILVKYIQSILKTSLFYRLLIIFIIVYFLLNMIGALAPPIHHDTLSYHLYAPKKYLLKHGFFLVPDSIQSNMPLSIEMLYLFAIAVKGDIFANVIHYAMGVLVSLTILIFSVKYIKSYKVGILACIIFYSQPVVEWLSIRAKIDLGLVFYFSLMVYAFFSWIKHSENSGNRWLIISSIFLGLTASTKINTVIYFPLFFIAVFFNYLLNIRTSWSSAFNKAVLFSLIGFLIVMPWYTKLYMHIGTLYPSISENQILFTSFKLNIFEILLIPWNMVFHIDKFKTGTEPASVIYLAFLPCLFFIKKEDRDILILLIVSLLLIAICFLSLGIISRFIVPSLSLLPIIYAFLINKLFERSGKLLKIFVMTSLIINYFIYTAELTACNLKTYLPVVIGLESRDAYLSRLLPFYDTYKFINLNLPMNAKIFSPDETRGYYLEREFITGNSMYAENFSGIITCADLVKRLKELGFTHIMLNKNYQNTLIEMFKKNKIPNNPENNLFYKYEERLLKDNYCRLVFEKNNIFLYELVNRPSIN